MIERVAPKAEQLAESVWLKLAARGSMIALGPLLTASIMLGLNWLDGKFASTDDLQTLSNRVLTLENNTTRGRADREKFQDLTTRQLEQINQAVGSLARGVAKLEATIEAQQRQLDRAR
jgi:hypothetical protein